MGEPLNTSQIYLVTKQKLSLGPDDASQAAVFAHLLKTCNFDFKRLQSARHLPQTSGQDLIFFDAEMETQVLSVFFRFRGPARWVVFNAQPGSLDECEAIIAGLDGVFYAQEEPELVLKGLKRLQKMDVWFRRKSINAALREMRRRARHSIWSKNKGKPAPDSALPLKLTKRELSIIQLVSKGAQNKEIAEQLHISVNTVKTHIYSIFRKTESRNRIELLSWCQDYINEFI
ncbi:DNA-binding response regulator [Alteromonas aestuariivivens]|uniref:DNA-binding response regulator n=1 Tax=Alteromonas aestuariivivens TaxID=1938339 RepID=A0A3D8M767_9ALTE|nr:response regulator transcription factor [Alteromonas aestuariivivens]RDV25490.1 DNA-binding response regulator [Alteromonas aestuariivivens]